MEDNPSKVFFRLFNTSDGKRVIEHLKRRTLFQVVHPSDSPDILRDLEGQRRLMFYILNLIERGYNE